MFCQGKEWRLMKFDKNMTSVGTSLLILHLLENRDMYGYQIISELADQSDNIFEFKRVRSIRPARHAERRLYRILCG